LPIRNLFKTRIVAPLWILAFVATNSPLVAQAQQPVVYQSVASSPRVVYTQPAATVTYAQPAATAYTYAQQAATYAQPAATAYTYAQPATTTYAQPAAAATAGDPYGFTNWLNSVRASYGLPAVGYDPNLSSWAAANNNQQQAYGMGHHVMGPARRQNSAMGAYASIGAMWMASPAHRAALLDPTIRAIGIAGLGAYWTFNAN